MLIPLSVVPLWRFDGLMMIRAIIDQYNGTLELKNYSGAWVRIEVDME
jgi:nitrogen fixation/metabolism regulation signal transduction histidine kinase